MVQKQAHEEDWWWQLRLGMCYYQLGLFQDAIRHFELSLQLRPMDETVLHLNKAYLRIDQPLIAAKMFKKLAEAKPGTFHAPQHYIPWAGCLRRARPVASPTSLQVPSAWSCMGDLMCGRYSLHRP